MPQAEASHPVRGASSEPSPAIAILAERLRSGTCHIGIYGLGYVGLPLALRFAEMGIRVTGFDIDSHKVDTLNVSAVKSTLLPLSVLRHFFPDLLQIDMPR